VSLQAALHKISQRQDLSFEEAAAAMQILMAGEATPAQIGAYLMGLRLKGETVAEIAGSAYAMRQLANNPHVTASDVIDTCGTGGDGAHTFNISTTVAFVVAGAGVPVAKHGNRSVSSRSGSADVLRELGVNLDLTPEQAGRCVDDIGIGFLFAPTFHPAMRHAIGPRREMGLRTIFNILGPLTNPAGAKRQLMGVFAPHLTPILAQVLRDLGSKSVMVVHGNDGLDELTTTTTTTLSTLHNGQIHNTTLDPLTLGLRRAQAEDLVGGGPAENAAITWAILKGRGTPAQREIVMLNSAAALMVAGRANTWEEGLHQAAHVLDSGAGAHKLEELIAYSQGLAVSTQH
jgi:anthranilate phosphoribosyltransferase